HGARGPLHPHGICDGGIAQTELRHQAVTVVFPIAARNLPKLPALCSANVRPDPDLRPNRRPIGDGPHAPDAQPMIAIAVIMVEEIVLARSIRHKKIKEAVVIVIAPGASDGITAVGDDVARGYFAKRPVPVIPIEKISLARSVRHVK